MLLDFLLAYSTVGLEYFSLVHEPYSYQLTTILRLLVGVVAWWKLSSAATISNESNLVCKVDRRAFR